jgi:NAD(P)-dependent dehydrogenase (short-subunit alcohol dehydrogenase family)
MLAASSARSNLPEEGRMGQIEGQVAIVTGAASEVAQGIARRFAREGALVVLVDRDAAAATRAAAAILAEGGRAEAYSTDMAAEDAAASLAKAVAGAHGGINILVNGVHAALAWAPFAEKQESDFADAFSDVVLSAVAMMRAVRPHMQRCGGGRIVNVGSIYGPTANEGVTDAVTIDGALAALTRSVGIEWARDNILVNYLQPAVPDIAVFRKYHAERGRVIDHLLHNIPMQRLADPVEDIGGAAMFLASDEACFVVGHKVFADGGQHMTAAVFEPGAAR